MDGFSHWDTDPLSVQSPHIDVYTENRRDILTIESPYFGTVWVALVGAFDVSSMRYVIPELTRFARQADNGTVTTGSKHAPRARRQPQPQTPKARRGRRETRAPSDTVFVCHIPVRKGQEIGWFEYGGSTVVLAIEKGRASFCPFIVQLTQQDVDSDVKMGEYLGHAVTRRCRSVQRRG
jgi:phosphatidylserine decarboxylase